MSSVHIFTYLIASLIPCPPQNSEHFFPPFSADTLPMLADTSHILLESPSGRVSCLWFFIASAHRPRPLCFHIPTFAFSRERGMEMAESSMRRPRGRFRIRQTILQLHCPPLTQAPSKSLLHNLYSSFCIIFLEEGIQNYIILGLRKA